MMEKKYTSKIGRKLTERLYEAGMPLKVNTEYEVNKFTNKVDKKLDIEPPSYAKTMDWFASKGFIVVVYPIHCLYCGAEERWETEFDIRIHNEHTHESECPDPMHNSFKTWHEAADYGIEKALELLKQD